ncbi:MAG TPA: STAS domain-containing protein [Candidatus Acidoferrales bacterium]|jgi:anti-anti-sigma factor|nr:STAS domain-containing protein [Candidatus Acidoferrales bacterium]
MAQPNIVELTGRIDNVTSAEIETSIGLALDAAPSALILDFSQVTFVSSIGLRVLLMAAKRCRKQNTPFALHSVSKPIVDLFRVSGLTEFFPIHPTRETALAAFV